MQENNRRLIDEALSFEPIKNTFRLGWEFITLNKKFTYISLMIAIGTHLLSQIDPIVGFFMMLFYGFYILAVQIEVGRVIYKTADIETFLEEVRAMDVNQVLRDHIERVIGAVIGWSLLYTLLMLFFAFLVAILYTIVGDMTEALVITVIPAIALLLLIAYLQPLIQAKVALSANVEEAMFAVFSIRLPHFRAASFNGFYFKYVVSLLFLLLALPFIITLLHSFGFFSVLGIFVDKFLMLTLPIIAYIASVIIAVGYMMASRMVEERV